LYLVVRCNKSDCQSNTRLSHLTRDNIKRNTTKESSEVLCDVRFLLVVTFVDREYASVINPYEHQYTSKSSLGGSEITVYLHILVYTLQRTIDLVTSRFSIDLFIPLIQDKMSADNL
jgi:hypothetical protein